VENVGTGRMPVEVAAVSGERWRKPESRGGLYTAHPDYRDARATVRPGGGEKATLTVRCDFEPETLVVDPDVRVLQLHRKQAVATL
jgi:hypothetical protein